VTVSRVTAVGNTPPVAAAGGPYTVTEFGSVKLDGLSGSSDANQAANTLTYEWDFDGDGVFGEASTAYGDERGPKPTFVAKFDGPTDVPIHLRVTDADGAQTIADAVVHVKNVAPVLANLTNSSPDGSAFMGKDVVTIAATFSDVGLLDTHKVTID